MLALGIWLVATGVCDLLRAARDTTTPLRRWLVVAVGLLVLFLLLVPAGMTGSEWLGLGLTSAVSLVAWVVGSSVALQHESAIGRAVAFAGFGAGVTVTGLGGSVLETWEWPGSLDGTLLARHPADLVVLIAGVALAQLATANVMVRLVLDAVGVPATTNEKQLKGGRMLGPMERLFIVGLGLAGSVTAAAIVVAAKGLLRFPELQQQAARGDERAGPSDVTEYFLIGSFASWLVALAGLGLVALGS